MKNLVYKHREVVAYLFFGVATTVVNLVIFFTCTDLLGMNYKISNVIGWFFSVLFAFFTNKYFVFSSKHKDLLSFFVELLLFYWYRILSFILDMGMMIFMIDRVHISDFWAKMITQAVVILLNYFFSKFVIFRKKL